MFRLLGRRGKRETDVMEGRSTTTSATTALQGGNENHGNDSETQVMAIEPTTTSVTSTPQGGIQVGNNNKMIYRNCSIANYITQVTNKCKRCHPAEEHDVSEDVCHMTTRMRLVDCEGRELKLGHMVVANGDIIMSIYAGDGMIIGVNEKTGKIVHEPIHVEEPFRSYTGWGAKYSRIQIVLRAKGKVGQKYDYEQLDFVYWCYTDMTLEERTAHKRRKDSNHNAIYQRPVNAKY